ncbi:hypothetical protein PJF56_00565 [Roseofilum sp. BLCC_M91]|uniref:Uncharacterized protein n=1 Tax=Roseofilum halophilum BLCC-M91 TaxID=3022259 RepID=A0ABT7BDU0_9CYAN|nr:hypothetical protein [Roseofilum halophilum]MDJ1177345.1 hypothetical protein [Roseofilum halophilum BLCC-M91]
MDCVWRSLLSFSRIALFYCHGKERSGGCLDRAIAANATLMRILEKEVL